MLVFRSQCMIGPKTREDAKKNKNSVDHKQDHFDKISFSTALLQYIISDIRNFDLAIAASKRSSSVVRAIVPTVSWVSILKRSLPSAFEL